MAHYLDISNFGQGGFEEDLKPAPKRIVVCCDGSWQSSATNHNNVPSNVTRIARYLLKIGKDDQGQQWQQVVYYDAGVGANVGWLEAKFQGFSGSGFVENVIEAYNFIVLNYNPGDQIFCVGFSRGAYTARAVAGLVTDIGVLKPRDMQDFPELFRLYQAHNDSHTFRTTATWREWVEGKRLFDATDKNLPKHFQKSSYSWVKRPHGAPPESTRWVEAVAVFDTVGSLGIPEVEGWKGTLVSWVGKVLPIEKFGFHNVALSPFIKHAYHAMAIDEHRKPFDVTLWHFPAEGVATTPKPKAPISELREKWSALRESGDAKEPELSEAWVELIEAEMYDELKGHKSTLKQCYFPGYHVNIGGGSEDLVKDVKDTSERKSDFEQIAMITFMWMVEQLKPHLTFGYSIAELATVDRFMYMRPIVEELLKPENRKKDHWLVKKIDSLLAKDSNDPWDDGNKTRAKVLAADALRGWATGPIIDSYETKIMRPMGSKYRTPGEYKETKLQSGGTVKLGKTNEEIHPCVAYRMQQLGGDYKPVALKDFKRQKKVVGDTVSYEWVKNDVRIPEYKIAGNFTTVERSCVVSPDANEFLGRLDKEYGFVTSQTMAIDAANQPPRPPGSSEQHGFDPNNGFQSNNNIQAAGDAF
ncbi:hypothetical protein B0H63DRAFT_305005 [Podospora didyma]|uniref:T6SS Phospholipase effector Tle1-like catalytic domain-containing protein n=1 Tax=Podospora didyma TaxID=330526 RepID=A0AAE0K5V3_9PEZI|nr:hypothetical protein B0H63DRAFT_305005 [Podospora didyma]